MVTKYSLVPLGGGALGVVTKYSLLPLGGGAVDVSCGYVILHTYKSQWHT